MNKFILMGRLVKDPELRYSNSGKGFAYITLAVNHGKDGEGNKKTVFFPITVWGKLAEATTEYAKKGSTLLVEGRIQNVKINEKFEIRLVANRIEFVNLKKPDNNVNISTPSDDLPF